jgi:hypothetical protein
MMRWLILRILRPRNGQPRSAFCGAADRDRLRGSFFFSDVVAACLPGLRRSRAPDLSGYIWSGISSGLKSAGGQQSVRASGCYLSVPDLGTSSFSRS